MIPYRIQFHGIRDYQPTQLTFGDDREHILITGPNGTGKSTISFCFGAVLNSSKVAVEGLRSNNLPADQEWHAMIQLLFHNVGRTQIDAPAFIAFRINMTQQTQHTLVQRQFTILTGATAEELTEIDVFRSGDANQRNFKAYEEELRYKYKIFPDAYYLIWYQQEVNQFSTMSPEERFRRFSDMHNISATQQQWESFVEQAQETEEELRTARAVVKEAKYNLNLAQNEFEAFEQNKKRLHEYGTSHVQYIRSMQSVATNQQQQLLTEQQSITIERQQNELKIEKLHKQLTKITTDLQNQENNLLSAQTGRDRKQLSVEQVTSKLTTLEQHIQTIREQLQETENQRKRLRYTEQQTLNFIEQTTEKMATLTEQQAQLTVQEQQLQREQVNSQTKMIETTMHIKKIQDEQQQTKELLVQYKSSHAIEQQIITTQQQLRSAFSQEIAYKQSIDTLQQSIALLQKNKIYSPRQQTGLADLKSKGIQAYALRDLIDMTTLREEALLSPIKYTIFYDARDYKPLNDLYYVSLKQIVPNRSVTAIPSLQLKIRNSLSEIEQNFASKALWWVEQFLLTAPKLQNGLLHDTRGTRGAQEVMSYILSDPAVYKHLQEDTLALEQQQQTLARLKQQQQLWQQHIEEQAILLPTMRKAEAQQLEAHSLNHYTNRLAHYEEQMTVCQTQLTKLNDAIRQLIEERSVLQHELNFLQHELTIYEQLGQLKSLQEEQQALQEQRDTLRTLLQEEQRKMHTMADNIRISEEKIRQFQSLKQAHYFEIKDRENTIQALIKQQQQLVEDIATTEAMSARLQLDLEELQRIMPELYIEACSLPIVDDSMSSLLALNAQAKSHFDDARLRKVNPDAENNYLAVQKDYAEKKVTVRQTEVLLESTQQHAREVEHDLMTTIDMHIRTIHDLFEQYMEQFNFEGKVEFERYMDNKNRAIFRLYIKVRKIGHRGALEDVSVKARNGRYGKGVSGGEESLSSLLFALALLQNLEVNPNFIMLDEFDSALDDARKERVFDLYASTLNRKLFILSPKVHSDDYYRKFARAFIVEHNARIPRSSIRSIYQT